MILFDLRCNDCDKKFTAFVAYSKLPDEKCPNCKSTNHSRIYKANIKEPIRSSGSGFTPTSSGFT